MSKLSRVALSVLDVSPIVQGSTAREALHNTLDLARLADELGYRRYWVPEHHSMRGVASAAPAVLVGQIATATTRIRVGSGGVLLPNHSPIVIAEQFGTLEAFHPGRVDLGIGRAPGGSTLAAQAVRVEPERTARPFAEQLAELLGYFDPPADQKIRAIPAHGNAPPVWLLGSSTFSAQLAGELGLPYAFAHHLHPERVTAALRLYRESFRPSPRLPDPFVLVSVSAIVADSDDHAHWLSGPNKLKVLSRGLGRRILLPTPEEAAAYPYTHEDRAKLEEWSASHVIGSPDAVAKGLQQLLDETAADELMITTKVHDHADRRHSYELLVGLTG